MTADAEALAYEQASGYRQGYGSGYLAGVADGRSQGYVDAKVRAHAAVAKIKGATARLNATVGKVDEE